MDLVTVDIESYYDDEYSLSKVTTEEYVRSPQFEIIGVGVKVNGHEADWYSGDHPDRFLNALDFSNKAILCHHTAFDGAILSWVYGIRPKFWFDTLSMARPLHGQVVGGSLAALAAHYNLGVKGDDVVAAKGMRRMDFDPLRLAAYGAYCRNDCDLTYALFNKLKHQIPVSELIVIDQTLRMYTEPVIQLDAEALKTHLDGVLARKAKLVAELKSYTGRDSAYDMLASNDRFADYLKQLGVDPPMKMSPRTGKLTYAFAKVDEGLLRLLDHPNEDVQTVVAARLGVKSTLEETRTTRLLNVAGRGTLPIMLNFYGAHTGRFSGGDKLNLQNLPKRGNNTIRKALLAPYGHVFVSADAKQIEARIVAWLAGEEELLQAFREGRDIYREFAAEAYGVPLSQVSSIMRFVGKTCILGLNYGMGPEKLQNTLRIGQGGISIMITMQEAERFVRLYREKYWRIYGLGNRYGGALTQMVNGQSGQLHDTILPFDETGIELPNKLKLQYPMLHREASGFKYCANPRAYRIAAKYRVLTGEVPATAYSYIYGGMVVENVTQALAGLAAREYMAAIGQHYKIALQTHDDILLCVLLAQQDRAMQDITTVMSTPPVWAPDLPVACEVSAATNYGDV